MTNLPAPTLTAPARLARRSWMPATAASAVDWPLVTRLLLTSDAGATVERRLLQNHADVRADVIIKGRHGDEVSCTEEFLDAVKPSAVVQCVSAWPSGRYLQPDLRDRLNSRKVTYYRTDEAGAVTIRLNKTGYHIRTCMK